MSIQSQMIQNLTIEQCQHWIDTNGTINPATNRIMDPNLLAPNSLNARIANKCAEFGMIRNGNPYNPSINIRRRSSNNSRIRSSNNVRQNSNNNTISNSQSRRQSNSIYKDSNGNIHIVKNVSFKYSELKIWWNNGVMEKNNNIHYKNPETKKNIKENYGLYNRLLQQADAVCLIPINIDSLYEDGYISKESFEILTDIREEIEENDWNIEQMKIEHNWMNKSFPEKYITNHKFLKYLFRFNSKSRIPAVFKRDNLEEIDSIDKQSVTSKSVENINDIDITCVQRVTNLHDKYKGFKNKMIRICDQYTKQITMMTETEIQQMISIYNSGPQHDEKQKIKRIIGQSPLLALFQQFYYLRGDPEFLNVSKENIYIRNYILNNDGTLKLDSGQDEGGLTNQMMSDIAQEMFDIKVFIKQSDESTKYTFNPKFEFTEEHIKFIQKMKETFYDQKRLIQDIKNGKIYIIFYEFIGRLLCFFLQNSFKLPHRLTTYILNIFKFKQNTIKNHEHVLYAMNDIPDLFQSILNLMKEDPSSIEDIGMEYNDIYKIQFDKESGDLITSENVEQYIIDFAKHVNSNNILRIDEGGTNNVKYMYIKFSQGIDDKFRKVFQYRNLSHNIIDKMLTTEEITTELLHKLYDNIFENIENQNVEDVTMNHLHDYRSYIKNVLFNKRYDNEKLFASEDDHTTFIKKLLQFWTGLNYYKHDIKYIIEISNATSGYPVSHTCFNTIDMPRYNNEQTFWNKLKEAVESSFNTFQIAGGAIKKKKSKKSISKR